MKKNESHSALTKRLHSVKVPCSKCTPMKRQASANQSSSLFKKQATNSSKTLSSTRASTTSRINLKSSSKSSSKLKENQEYLLNTLKTYILKSSRDLNLIQKEIPKFTARKIQDLKKGYKFNEDFDALASSFLAVFGEIDEELKKEMISLRMKIGEHLVAYFSNSGKFIKILKNLTEVFKKVDIGAKALSDACKMLEVVKREKLSTNYQDLYDFMYAIIRFFKSKKSNSKLLNDGNKSFLCTTTPERLICTQSIINQSTEMSFTDCANPLSCSNKSSSLSSIFRRPPQCKTPKESTKALESVRYSSHKSLSKRINRLDDSKASDIENSVCVSRDQQSVDRRKEWDEIRKRKKLMKTHDLQSMVSELNLKRLENLKFDRLIQEQRKKEKDEMKLFRDQEFKERKRIKRLESIKRKEELVDEITRNLQRSLISKKNEF